MTVYNGAVILILTIVPPLVLWRIDSNLLKEILKDLRPLRIIHYFILTLLGAHIYYHSDISGSGAYFKSDYLFQLVSFWLALVYAAVFAIISNNIEDVKADKISNPNRPLITGNVDPRAYLRAGFVSQCIAFAIAICSSWFVLFGIMGISLGYYLYSCSPFRLKRIPIFAKFMIGFNSLIAAVTGFAIIGGEPLNFPFLWLIFILIPLSLAANFIDLKDIEGDKAAGIKTLPVMFGERKAKLIIGIFTILTYAMGGILINKLWLYPFGTIALAFHLWFLFREPFKEKPVFLIYIISLLVLVILLLFP